jgi:hypothetical protein
MPDDVALEKVQLAEMLGATVERVRPGKLCIADPSARNALVLIYMGISEIQPVSWMRSNLLYALRHYVRLTVGG